MRAFDTNLLVRYITNDEPRQAEAANQLMRGCEASGERLFIPVIVLCEFVWVLSRRYEQPKQVIVHALDKLAATALFVFERDDLLRRSIDQWRTGRAGFTDYVIANIAGEAGCTDTVTFDRKPAGVAGFTVLR